MLKQVQTDWNEVQLSAIEYNRVQPNSTHSEQAPTPPQQIEFFIEEILPQNFLLLSYAVKIVESYAYDGNARSKSGTIVLLLKCWQCLGLRSNSGTIVPSFK